VNFKPKNPLPQKITAASGFAPLFLNHPASELQLWPGRLQRLRLPFLSVRLSCLAAF
jgi:hypothetical protein